MKAGAIYKVNDSPDIWLSVGATNWQKLENNRRQPAYLLVHPNWYFGIGSAGKYWQWRAFLRKRGITLILLNNSRREHWHARAMGFRSYFINQNIHVCEHRFSLSNAEKIWDAIYVAQASAYKRIHLAERINNLYVVTYFWPDVRNEHGEWDLAAFEPRVKHADYNRHWMKSDQVADLIGKSRCGLALSQKEGAMFGIMEYLYSGVPVVSTRSLGGRDKFLRPDYSIIVDDDPQAVLKGVNDLISRDLDPAFVRESALELVNMERTRFYGLCRKLTSKADGALVSYDEFYNRTWGHPLGIEGVRFI